MLGYDEAKNLKPFTLVTMSDNNDIYVLLTECMQIPYFNDGIASDHAFTPVDFTSPEEWKFTFPGYIAYNTADGKYKILSANHCIEIFEQVLQNGYHPFDYGAGDMRRVLGLIALGEKLYGHTTYSDRHLKKTYLQKEE